MDKNKYRDYKRCSQTELAKLLVKKAVIEEHCHPKDVAERLDVSREYVYNLVNEIKQ